MYFSSFHVEHLVLTNSHWVGANWLVKVRILLLRSYSTVAILLQLKFESSKVGPRKMHKKEDRFRMDKC